MVVDLKKIVCFFACFFVIVNTHAQNRSHLRVVSLVPSVTESIYQLNASDMLVGCTNYCTRAVADSVDVVASAVKVNIEKTLSLKPDIVFAAELVDPETVNLLRKVGLKVEVFRTPKSFVEVNEQFLRIAGLINKKETAQAIIATVQSRVDSMLMTVSFLDKKFFMQIGANPIFSVLPNTFMNDYITLSGGKNVSDEMTGGVIGRESVIYKNPDYIFIVTMGILADEEKKIWQSYRGMRAADTGSIFIIDAEKACLPTPVTFAETLQSMFTLMQNNTSAGN